jgi:flagellar motor switch protein FliM
VNPDISQEEVDALLGGEERSVDAVTPRDFTRPKRFSAEQLEQLSKQISSCLPAVERAMSAQGSGGFELSLYHTEETTRDAFVSSLEERGFFIQSVSLDGAAGWVQWDPMEARQAIEQNLGCGSTAGADAPLSDLERSLASDFVMLIVTGVANELGISVSADADYIERRLLQASVDGAPGGDDQRLSITLELSGCGLSSKLYLYLPGVAPAADACSEGEAPSSLPSHFDDVEVPVIAELASIELPLEGVLALEEGDVITLGSGRDTTARLVVDGRPAGSASWGQDGDRIALTLLDLSIKSTD